MATDTIHPAVASRRVPHTRGKSGARHGQGEQRNGKRVALCAESQHVEGMGTEAKAYDKGRVKQNQRDVEEPAEAHLHAGQCR